LARCLCRNHARWVTLSPPHDQYFVDFLVGVGISASRIQLPQAPTSSGIAARQPDAAGIVNGPAQSRLSAAGIVAAPVTARIPGNPVKGIEPDASARLKDISAGEGGAMLPWGAGVPIEGTWSSLVLPPKLPID
jgi:hypothetical protein